MKKFLLVALFALGLVACSKKEEAPAVASEPVAAVASEVASAPVAAASEVASAPEAAASEAASAAK